MQYTLNKHELPGMNHVIAIKFLKLPVYRSFHGII